MSHYLKQHRLHVTMTFTTGIARKILLETLNILLLKYTSINTHVGNKLNIVILVLLTQALEPAGGAQSLIFVDQELSSPTFRKGCAVCGVWGLEIGLPLNIAEWGCLFRFSECLRVFFFSEPQGGADRDVWRTSRWFFLERPLPCSNASDLIYTVLGYTTMVF